MTNYQNYSTATSSFTPHDEKVKFDLISVSKSSGRFIYGDYFPLPYSIYTEKRILKYLEMDIPMFEVLNAVNDLTPEEFNQLHYLLLSLESYYKQQNPMIPRHILIYLVITREGLKTLKIMRLKSFLLSNGGTLLEKPDWFDKIPFYHSYDIGEIFNYNYGFFWEEEDTKDYLISEVPVEVDKEILGFFKKIVNRIINDSSDFQEVLPDEVLFRVNSSSSIDDNMDSYPNYLLKSKNLRFSSVRSEGKRVLITTGPGQGRDAIINNINDLNSIQLINENIRKFLEMNFRDSILTGPSSIQQRRYFKRCNKYPYFYCRDIRKEGLSKPKYLCEIILSALHRRFPKNIAFMNPHFYSGPWYEGDKTQRGHGLGMANELTTLMQLMLLYTTNYAIGKGGDYVSSVKSFFLNDDSIIFIKGSDEDLDTFIDYDYQVCSGLGILVQKDKSFYSNSCAIFCEMYYCRGKPFVNNKESYAIRETEIIRRSSNILEAKFYAGNMKGSLSQIEDTLKKTYISLGYEFNKDEINWPITLGGLRPFKLLNIDQTLKYVSTYKDIRILYRAFNANKERKLKRWNKYLKDFIPPIIQMYPILKKEQDPEILEKLGLGSISNLSGLFFRPSKEHKLHWAVEKLYRRRETIFKETLASPTYEDFCKIYSSESLSNVALDELFVKKFIPVKIFHQKSFRDPYSVINPMSSYLNYLGAKIKNIPSTRWGLFQQNCVISAEKSVFARQRAMNTLSLIDRFEEDFETELLIFPENDEDIDEFMESYPKPFMTYGLVKNGNLLPIPKEDFRNPILKLRKEVYGRYLNLREVYLSQTYKWERMDLILKFEEYFKGMIDFDNDFWTCVDARVEASKTVPLPPEEVSDGEKEMYKSRLRLDTLDIDIDQEFFEPSLSEKSDSDILIEYEEPPEETLEEVEAMPNPFMIINGPLPDGDISVYGSEEWLIWFFNEDRWSQDEILRNDKDLEYASVDTMAYQHSLVPGSDAFKEKNEVLEANLIHSAKLSWVAYTYFYVFKNIKVPEDDPFDAGDLFGNDM